MKKVLGRYNASRYEIVLIDNGKEEQIYVAGNSKHDSQEYLSADEGIGLEQMRKFCLRTTIGFGGSKFAEFAGIEPLEEDEDVE